VKTIFTMYDDVLMEIPEVPDFVWPTFSSKNFPPCCGAGGGWGEKLVPDSLIGINISPACFVHDWMYEYAPKDHDTFDQANSMMYRNILAIIAVKGKCLSILELVTVVKEAGIYYEAICTFGGIFFFKE